MKRFLPLILALAMTGCATSQSTKAAYVQTCAGYGLAFNAALQLRQAGKLTPAEIDQITMLDAQVTPICTGPLPADPTAATAQVTAAVTTLTMIETIKKVSAK